MWEALEVAQAARLRARRCPAGSTPASSRAAPTSPAGSASGCRSPARSCASPTSTCSTTRSRRSTSPPTPGCAPRSCPYTARRGRRHRGPAGLDHRRPPTTSSCSRTACVIGPRHARRAARRLPDLRGDRAVADRREERRHDAHRRPRRTRRARSSISPRPRRAPPGRWNSAGVPGERSKDFKNAVRRLVRHARPDAGRARHRRSWSRSPARRSTCSGPRSSGTAPTSSSRASSTAPHRLRRAAPRAVPGGRAVRGVVAAVDRRGVHARRRRPAAHVQAALRRRGQGQPRCRSATSTSSRAAICSAGSPTTSTTSRRACSRR